MSWEDILKTNFSEASDAIKARITNAPQYVKTAWGEVERWIQER